MYIFYNNTILQASEQTQGFEELTQEQLDFYLQNKTATADEVRKCELNVITLTNEEIAELRKMRYSSESDHYFIAYQKNIALNNLDAADSYRQKWLDAVSKIDVELPYKVVE